MVACWGLNRYLIFWRVQMRNIVILLFLNMMPCLQLQLARSKKQVQKHLWIFGRLMIYMFLLPHVLNNTFRTPVLFIFCCLSRKCFAQLRRGPVLPLPKHGWFIDKHDMHPYYAEKLDVFWNPISCKNCQQNRPYSKLTGTTVKSSFKGDSDEVTGGRVISH